MLWKRKEKKNTVKEGELGMGRGRLAFRPSVRMQSTAKQRNVS